MLQEKLHEFRKTIGTRLILENATDWTGNRNEHLLDLFERHSAGLSRAPQLRPRCVLNMRTALGRNSMSPGAPYHAYYQEVATRVNQESRRPLRRPVVTTSYECDLAVVGSRGFSICTVCCHALIRGEFWEDGRVTGCGAHV